MASTKKQTLTVTLPDGSKAQRTTNHNYTHVIVVMSVSGQWKAWSWSASEVTAAKRMSTYTGVYQIIPVDANVIDKTVNERTQQIVGWWAD